MPAKQTELTSRTFPKVLIEVRTGHTRTPKQTPFSHATILDKCEALLRYADLTVEEWGGYKEQTFKGKVGERSHQYQKQYSCHHDAEAERGA